jgi:hypothetical protein
VLFWSHRITGGQKSTLIEAYDITIESGSVSGTISTMEFGQTGLMSWLYSLSCWPSGEVCPSKGVTKAVLESGPKVLVV